MSRNLLSLLRLPVWAVMVAGMLGACAKPAPEPETATPAPASDSTAPEMSPPSSEGPPPPPEDSPAGPDQPTPEAPPPTDPSPVPTPASLAAEPPLATMQVASTNAKIGVPVDLRYQFEGDVLADQPQRLHLAAVPRVAGTNLKISIQRAPGVDISEGTLTVQKAAQAGIYRKQLLLTRASSGPAELRVLITMGVGEGSAHSFYTIPLHAGTDPGKQHSVKQR